MIEYFEWDSCLSKCYISGIIVYVNVISVSEAIKLNISNMTIFYINVTSVSEVMSLNILSGIVVYLNVT
jgi:hypothetical protein